jgi:hypothetical protein
LVVDTPVLVDAVMLEKYGFSHWPESNFIVLTV